MIRGKREGFPERFLPAFSLIEVMVVIAIVGSVMLVLSSLLSDLLNRRFTESEKTEITGVFSYGKKEAMRTGSILTMEINMEKKEFGIKKFSRDKEIRNLPDTMNKEFLLRPQGNSSRQNEEEQEEAYLLQGKKMPEDLEAILSVSGNKESGPFVYIHFYPDGTSDPVIFHFPAKEKPYLYVPSGNLPPLYMENLWDSIYEKSQPGR